MSVLYHERKERGTPDFPLELYRVDKNHPKYRMQMHWHKDFEIIRVLKGSLKLKLNENRFDLCENQCVFIPGGTMHGAEPDSCEYECIVFSPSVLYATPLCRSIVKKKMQSAVTAESSDTLNGIFEAMKTKKNAFELEAIGKLYLFCFDVVRENKSYAVEPNERLEKIKAAMSIIEENYSSKITLEDLALSCRLSPNYFSRYFKEIVGQTPFEYITVYRVEAACEMLAEGNKSITDICYCCGFNDLSYFIHIFKKYKGVSPGKYGQSLKKTR